MNYKYACKNETCGIEFDIQQSIHSSPLTACEACGTDSLERIIHLPMAFVRNEPKTIGHLANRNTENLSSLQRSEREAKAEADKIATRSEAAKAMGLPTNTKPVKPANKKLATLTDKQKETYIQTGRLP